MRVGTNPNRDKGADQFTPIVLTVVTHLPHYAGYHKNRLEVVKTCLTTMRDNSGGDYTVIVWDNGSCNDFREWVQDGYKPDIFIRSENVGKSLARRSLASMLPTDKIISYCDDDILFYPDWLNPQVELLANFPNVSAVTGYPVRTQFRWGTENTRRWGAKHGKMQTGRFIPDGWERDFSVSIGRDPDWHKNYTTNDLDYLVEYNGLKAYATAHHCQFIGYTGTIAKACVIDGEAMGDEKPFDRNLDQLGLRLATTERLTRHIGNVIDNDLRVEVIKCLSTKAGVI
jgi:glycosyltransferase involved in cell wall biosynthesis